MLRRNRVPTLKMICIRKLAFPTTATAVHHFLFGSNELEEKREVKNVPHHQNRKFFLGRQHYLKSLEARYHSMGQMSYGRLTFCAEMLVNAWIRLSAYYSTSLEQWNDISHYFLPKTITTLDFLHEGALLKNGQDIKKCSRVIPNATSPQAVEPQVYKELLDILGETENVDTLKNLFVAFAFPSVKTGSSARYFQFERTFRFVNLRKLEVHGPAADNSLLSAVGFWCKSLQYLDIRGTRISEQGILLLLLKHPKRDIQKFQHSPDYPNIPELLTDLTKTLEYLDMSTVQRQGGLLNQDKIVRMALPRLRGTLGRVYFLPAGRPFLICRPTPNEKLRLRRLRNTVFSFLRGEIFEVFSHLATEAYARFHFTESVTAMEIRRDDDDDESVVFFLHDFLVVLEFRLVNLSIVTVLNHAKSSMTFLPVDVLARLMPCLVELKASLEGVVTSGFGKLQRLTVPMVKDKVTLISTLRKSPMLAYCEIGEMLLSADRTTLDDSDVSVMFERDDPTSASRLEVFRLHFQNSLTLSPGLRDLVKFCPDLRIVGDLSCWAISWTSLLDFSAQLNHHNCDLIYEYKTLLYRTSTPCKEFYR